MLAAASGEAGVPHDLVTDDADEPVRDGADKVVFVPTRTDICRERDAVSSALYALFSPPCLHWKRAMVVQYS